MKRIKPSSYLFPLGFIIEVDNSNFNPNTFYNNGIWERIKGKVIVGVDENQTEFNTTGKIGGSKYLQNHKHGLKVTLNMTQGAGNERAIVVGGGTVWNDNDIYQMKNVGDGSSGNLQPYYTAYIWKLISYS